MDATEWNAAIEAESNDQLVPRPISPWHAFVVSRNLRFDPSNDIHVVLNHEVRLYGIAAIRKNRDISCDTFLSEICDGVPPHLKALSKGVKNLQHIFSIQNQTTFFRHRSLWDEGVPKRPKLRMVGRENLRLGCHAAANRVMLRHGGRRGVFRQSLPHTLSGHTCPSRTRKCIVLRQTRRPAAFHRCRRTNR